MKPRVTFSVGLVGFQRDIIDDLLQKFYGFAWAMEEFIKNHTIINRDDAEYRHWQVSVSATDTPHLVCVLARQNYSGDKFLIIGSFGCVLNRDDKTPNIEMELELLYPEFTTGNLEQSEGSAQELALAV